MVGEEKKVVTFDVRKGAEASDDKFENSESGSTRCVSGKRLRGKNTSVGGGNCCQAAPPTPVRSRGSGSRWRFVWLPLPLLSHFAACIPADEELRSM